MNFKYSFKHMVTSTPLESYTRKKIEDKIERFSTKPDEVHVIFSVDRHLHRVRCSIKGGDGFNIDAEYTTQDMYASVDGLAEKIEAQLKKRKERLKDHKKQRAHPSHFSRNPSTQFEQADIDAGDILKYEAARRARNAS